MKKAFILILILLFVPKSGAQNLIEVALTNQSLLVNEKPAKPKLPYFVLYEKDFFKGKSKLDSLNIQELIAKIDTVEIDYAKWTKSELNNRILVSEGVKIDLDTEITNFFDKSKEEKKKLKKEINSFNNEKSGLRNYPISISRPIITNAGNMAFITIIRGNSGGSSLLFKFENEKWEYYDYLERWAY